MIDIHHGCSISRLSKLPDASVDLVLTDPPYGNNQTYGRRQHTIAGDENPLVALSGLTHVYRVLRIDRTCLCFVDVRHLPFFENFVTRYTKFAIRDVLVWDKETIGFGRGFRKRYELAMVLEKGRPQYRSRSLANVLRYRRISRPTHPHQKPVELLKAIIQHTTDAGDTVLDPFMGSGSTGVAARELDRRFIGIELDQAYFDLARRRIGHAGQMDANNSTPPSR